MDSAPIPPASPRYKWLVVPPPAKAPLHIGVHVFGFGAIPLRKHPRAGQARLELVPRIVREQRPHGDIHRKSRVVAGLDFINGKDQVAGQILILPGYQPLRLRRFFHCDDCTRDCPLKVSIPTIAR